MGWMDWMKGKKKVVAPDGFEFQADGPLAAEHAILTQYLEETKITPESWLYYSVDLGQAETYQRIMKLDREGQARLIGPLTARRLFVLSRQRALGWQSGFGLEATPEQTCELRRDHAEARRELLQKLVPKLKIAARCSFAERFLVVRGDLRTYKIHLGSGNILMAPNDQYLCIVAGPAARGPEPKVFLPFEGDHTLSVILSKAFLLAADVKITDETIVRQIRR